MNSISSTDQPNPEEHPEYDYPFSELNIDGEFNLGNARHSLDAGYDQIVRTVAESFQQSEILANTLNTASTTALEDELKSYREQQRSLSLEEVVQRYNTAFKSLNGTLVGFEDVIEQARLAFACNRNMMLIGETGEAKTLFANSVLNIFSGARTFSIGMTKATPEEDLVGMIHGTLAREHSLYYHNTAGSIVEAQFAFLDEFPDANTYTQRALLPLLNEHEFNKGTQQNPAHLRSAIAAGNYFSSESLLRAVHDRFACWAFLDNGFDPLKQMLIDEIYLNQNGRPSALNPDGQISMAELTYINDVLNPTVETDKKVTVPAYVVFLKNQITAAFLKEANGDGKESGAGVEAAAFLSPRRMAWGNDFMKARALLAGRSEVGIEDLEALALTFTMPGDPFERDRKWKTAMPPVLREHGSQHANNSSNVEYLFNVRRQVREVANAVHRGETFEMSLGQRICSLVGLLDKREVPFKDLKQDLRLKNLESPTHQSVNALRERVVEELHNVVQRLDPKAVENLIK